MTLKFFKVHENRCKFVCTKLVDGPTTLLNINQCYSYDVYCLIELIREYNMKLVAIKSNFQGLLVPNYRDLRYHANAIRLYVLPKKGHV